MARVASRALRARFVAAAAALALAAAAAARGAAAQDVVRSLSKHTLSEVKYGASGGRSLNGSSASPRRRPHPTTHNINHVSDSHARRR